MRFLRRLGWLALALLGAALALSLWFAPPREVRGTWITDGYGYGFDIGRFRTRVLDLSPVHCTTNQVVPSNRWLLDRAAGYQFSAQGNRLTVQVDEILNPIHANRAPLPDHCGQSPAPDRAHIYAVFWHSFATHYPSFDLFGVDWEAARDPGPLPDDAALLAAMTGALDGLHDGHVLIATDPQNVYSPQPDPDWISAVPAFARTAESLLSDRGTLPEAGITHGWLDGNIGYIRIDHLNPPRPFGRDFQTIAQGTLSPLADLYGDAEGLVLDLRWNAGGSDSVALGYAALFADTTREVGSKETQIEPGRLTRPLPIMVDPSGPAAFDMPVIVLTAPTTISAGEILTMALRELPQVTVMGTPTNGSFSDILIRDLPNGWVIGLSHQVYRTPDGTNWEGRGLPPDAPRDFDAAGLRAGQDNLLQEAAEALRGGITPSE